MCSLGGCGAAHLHAAEQDLAGSRWLFPAVDIHAVQCLNEAEDGAGAAVIKPFASRGDPLPQCVSDDGPELLFVVPFTETVRLRSICLVRPAGISEALLWANRADVDFGNASSIPPTAAIRGIIEDVQGLIEYPVNAARFANTTSITCLLRGSGDNVGLTCLGFRGEWTGLKGGAVSTTYEIRASVKDHAKPESAWQTPL